MPPKKTVRAQEAHVYLGFNLHSSQKEVFSSTARFRVLACGRKFGKTQECYAELLYAVSQGQRVAYMCPTFNMLSEMWRQVKDGLAPIEADKSEQEHRLETTNGAVVRMFSLDNPFSVRPFEFDLVIVDEAAYIDLTTIWPSDIRPTLMKRRGRALFASSPCGFNGFWSLFQLGQPLFEGGPSREAGWQSWQKPSWDNPHLDMSIIEEARRTTPINIFSQEYEAKFISDAGAVFRHVAEAAIALSQKEAREGHSYVIGADLAKTNDFSVYAVLDVTMMALVYIDVANHIDYSLQLGRLSALARRFRAFGIVIEQNKNDYFMEQMVKTGLPIIPFTTGGGGPSGGTKALIIEALAGAFDNSRLTILNDPELIGQLHAFQMERLPSGGFRYSGPHSGHDDYVMALALAYHGATYGVPAWSPEIIELEAPREQLALPSAVDKSYEVVAWPVDPWLYREEPAIKTITASVSGRYADILVRTPNPRSLDELLGTSFASVLQEDAPGAYRQINSCYVARCYGDVEYLKFALANQGYAEFVADLDVAA